MYDYSYDELEPQEFDPNVVQTPTPPKKRRTLNDTLLELAPLGTEEEALTKQMAYAQELRGTPMQDLRHAGRVVVAANPLEGLNTAVRRAGGGQARTQAMEDQKALAEKMRQIIAEGMQ